MKMRRGLCRCERMDDFVAFSWSARGLLRVRSRYRNRYYRVINLTVTLCSTETTHRDRLAKLFSGLGERAVSSLEDGHASPPPSSRPPPPPPSPPPFSIIILLRAINVMRQRGRRELNTLRYFDRYFAYYRNR